MPDSVMINPDDDSAFARTDSGSDELTSKRGSGMIRALPESFGLFIVAKFILLRMVRSGIRAPESRFRHCPHHFRAMPDSYERLGHPWIQVRLRPSARPVLGATGMLRLAVIPSLNPPSIRTLVLVKRWRALTRDLIERSRSAARRHSVQRNGDTVIRTAAVLGRAFGRPTPSATNVRSGIRVPESAFGFCPNPFGLPDSFSGARSAGVRSGIRAPEPDSGSGIASAFGVRSGIALSAFP